MARRTAALLAAVWLGAACASAPPAPAPDPVARDQEVYRRAERERIRLLEREVELLRGELAEAEQALVEAESGLRAEHTRADAVSSLAEARIQLDRARREARWQAAELDRAEEKLAEAERQVGEDRFATAIFFAARAERTARRVQEEALRAERSPGARRVAAERVNLREGPSTDDAVLAVLAQDTPVFPEREADGWVLVRTVAGRVGWIHGSLVR